MADFPRPPLPEKRMRLERPNDVDSSEHGLEKAVPGKECWVNELSDDLLARIFSTQPTLADKFRLELVCRRWRRMMREHVWTGYRRLSRKDFTGISIPDGDDIHRWPAVENMKYKVLLSRMNNLVELDLADMHPKVVDVCDNLCAILTHLPQLQHLRLSFVTFRSDSVRKMPKEVKNLRTLVMDTCSIGDADDIHAWEGLGYFFTPFTHLEMLVFTLFMSEDDWERRYNHRLAALPPKLKHIELQLSSVEAVAEWQTIILRDCPLLEVLGMGDGYGLARPSTSIYRPMLLLMREFGDATALERTDEGRLTGVRNPLRALRIDIPAIEDIETGEGPSSFDSTLTVMGATLEALEITYCNPKMLQSIVEHCRRVEHLGLMVDEWEAGEIAAFRSRLDSGLDLPLHMPNLKSFRLAAPEELVPLLLEKRDGDRKSILTYPSVSERE